MTKLIVLRGPSGSGKSTVAKIIRDKQGGLTALIEQDYVRRTLLREKDSPNGHNIELIKTMVLFGLKNSYSVVLEGILDKERYGQMFQEIIAAHPENNHFFYFDISFEETLNRHNTKPNKDAFGEPEMRQWYRDKDFFEFVQEEVISEVSALDETVATIMSKTTSMTEDSGSK